jgi:hypothetical protein
VESLPDVLSYFKAHVLFVNLFGLSALLEILFEITFVVASFILELFPTSEVFREVGALSSWNFTFKRRVIFRIAVLS